MTGWAVRLACQRPAHRVAVKSLQPDHHQMLGLLDVRAAEGQFDAAADGLQTFSVPVERYQDEGQDALLLVDGPETDAVLDYFRGTGPEPPAPDTADTSGATAT